MRGGGVTGTSQKSDGTDRHGWHACLPTAAKRGTARASPRRSSSSSSRVSASLRRRCPMRGRAPPVARRQPSRAEGWRRVRQSFGRHRLWRNASRKVGVRPAGGSRFRKAPAASRQPAGRSRYTRSASPPNWSWRLRVDARRTRANVHRAFPRCGVRDPVYGSVDAAARGIPARRDESRREHRGGRRSARARRVDGTTVANDARARVGGACRPRPSRAPRPASRPRMCATVF